MARQVTEWARRVAAAKGEPIPGEHRGRHRALVALAVLAAVIGLTALVLSQVGGNQGEQFLAEFNPVDKKVKEAKGQLSAVLRTVRLGEAGDARRIDAGADAIEKAAKGAAVLDPPSELGKPLLDYRDANADLVANLHEFAQALRRSDRRELRRLRDVAIEAQGAAHRAERSIRDKLAEP